MVDIFEEVDEQLRSDRLAVLARRYLPWIAGVLLLALAVALGVWGYTAYQQKNTEAASQAYADGLDKLSQGDFNAAFARFGDAAAKPTPGYKALALMQQAGVRMDQKRVPEAVALFDQAAAATSNPVIADAARLKSAFALLDTAPYDQVEARLKPLMDSDRPFHALAREALGMAKLNAGRPQAALGDFQVLSLMADAPQDVRERAQAAITLIKAGTATGLPATVKAAKTLPPPQPQQQSQQQSQAQPESAAPPAGAAPDQSQPAGAAQ
ncbi:MAG TPA: tetratricopeptide repeat protein [Caulobacteraceae bacterium]|nr:tetratricopeptide repeat protein [Caulobacteraceae bacterium]